MARSDSIVSRASKKRLLRVISVLQEVCARCGLSFPAVSSAMGLLVEAGIARELTGKRRNQVFAYDGYLAILNEGTELP